MEGIPSVTTGLSPDYSDYAYLFEEGRYALIGELIDLQTGKNLTELSKGKNNLQLLKSFPETDMVIYPAEGKTLLTDHSEVAEPRNHLGNPQK